MKTYTVTIELDTIEVNVRAKNQADARKKAIARLNKRKVSNLARRHWPSNRKLIYAEEI